MYIPVGNKMDSLRFNGQKYAYYNTSFKIWGMARIKTRRKISSGVLFILWVEHRIICPLSVLLDL